MSVKNVPPYAPHYSNEVPSMMGVEGTLGTTDTGGTARNIPIGVNPATGAVYVQDLSGASGTTNIQGSVQVTGGTIFVSNPGSNVNVVTGTVTEVSFNRFLGTVGVVNSGTINRVGNLGTLELGSVVVNSLPQVSVGTVPNINVASGTQQTLGTVGVVNNGTLALVTTVSNVTNGSVNILTGTVTRLSNIGTLESGTTQLNPRPSRSIFTYGTTTTGTIGTLVNAGGAGVRIFINDCSIISHNGTVDAIISWGLAVNGGGATGGGVVARGNFGAQGGIQKSFPYPTDGGTSNVALTFNQLGGAGTVTYTVSYWTE